MKKMMKLKRLEECKMKKSFYLKLFIKISIFLQTFYDFLFE